MRRLLLLVVGGRVPDENVKPIADWLADPKSHGIAVFQVPERGARLVLVDIDSGAALADTDGAVNLAVLNHTYDPWPPDAVEVAEAALRLGANPYDVLEAVKSYIGEPKDGDPEDGDG